MFKFDELEALKEDALQKADTAIVEGHQITAALHLAYLQVYQNEQILRELKSSGWKLKVLSEK
jgi:hypothetical protein